MGWKQEGESGCSAQYNHTSKSPASDDGDAEPQ